MNKRLRQKRTRPILAPSTPPAAIELASTPADGSLSLSQEAEHLGRKSTVMKEQIASLESFIVTSPLNRAMHRLKTIDIVPADLDDDDFSSAPANRLSYSRRNQRRELQVRNLGGFVILAVALVLLAIWFSRLLVG
jgi:hypothetical protein